MTLARRTIATAALCCTMEIWTVQGQSRPSGEGGEVDLSARYPTVLTQGDTDPSRARAWTFSRDDLYKLTRFSFNVGDSLQITTQEADLAVGHSEDGAVWAIVIPRTNGTLTSPTAGEPEEIAHVWLRFHPRELGGLFPKSTVRSGGDDALAGRVKRIAAFKIRSSWHAGERAMIPEPKDMTIDADARNGLRRFFVVDRAANKADYVKAFEKQIVPIPQPLERTAAEAAFDQVWDSFDQHYSMFVLRPEVNWADLRDKYRPKRCNARTTRRWRTCWRRCCVRCAICTSG